jgi:quinol monooxygenase YgiN
MASVALVVKLTAKAGAESELAEFLAGAVELANQEAGTEVWLALRSDESTFWIVDAFPGDAERQAHIDGQIAAALFANADRLLAAAPEISPSEVLAQKK